MSTETSSSNAGARSLRAAQNNVQFVDLMTFVNGRLNKA